MAEDTNKPLAAATPNQADILKLLQANLVRSEEILGKIKFIKKYIFWQQTWGAVRLLIIAIPIILGFIYLPPLIRDSLESYRGLFN
ncbi:MAG: hypothetical protein WC905_00175 [Patescibacteria group bacterium]|jgi:hypothetical protein